MARNQVTEIRMVWDPLWEAKLDVIADRMIDDAATAVAHDMDDMAPRGATRRLRGSHLVERARIKVRHVGSSLFYARFASAGTGRHEIRPSSKPLLAVRFWPNRTIYRFTRVRHPGATGNQYMKRATYKKRAIVKDYG